MDMGLRGKCALITGGARGIGFATARLLAAQGARVALADIDGESAEDGAGRLRKEIGGEAIAVTADISSIDQVRAMIVQVSGELAPPDILVNSAAVLDNKTFVDSEKADWDRMLGVCLNGPMNVMHELLPGMIEREFGRMVFLASDAARVGQARLSYYAAAKGGVVALVKSVAQEVGQHGITMNVVSPGATNTELRQAREADIRSSMGEEKYADYTRKVNRRYPMGRIGEPDDIAGMIAYLASDKASWITGQVISVNGGFVMP
jgi:NAD(P)-dependent dehydrogenase (short-subunit alcohol dehydrogenase family)